MSAGRALFSLLLARIAFGVGFLAAGLRGSPLLWYFPLERRWSFERQPLGTHLAMDWYGRLFEGLGWALVAGMLGAAVTGWGPLARTLLRPERVLLLARTLALAIVFDLAVHTWVILASPREPFALPSGQEQPR